MSRPISYALRALALSIGLAIGSGTCIAAGNLAAPATNTGEEQQSESWYREHSAKPEIFLKMIEAYFPTLPKIELNRRGPARDGWDAWGNEAVTKDEAA